jgi:hypothetical protein
MEEMRSQIDRYFPFYQASFHPNPSPSIWLSFPIIFTNIMLFYYILYIVWTQNRFVTLTFKKWLTCVVLIFDCKAFFSFLLYVHTIVRNSNRTLL